jgi:hypothetical protein
VSSDDAAFERQLLGCQFKSAVRFFLSNATHFKHNATRTHHSYPELRIAFTGTHTGFSSFLGYRFIWEQIWSSLFGLLLFDVK